MLTYWNLFDKVYKRGFCKNLMGGKVVELDNSEEFREFVSNGVAVVDFFAEWCMPCLMMAPVVEETAEKFGDKIKFGKINIDENSEIAREYEVTSIPNFVVFKDGKPVGQFIGAMSAEEFQEKIKKVL